MEIISVRFVLLALGAVFIFYFLKNKFKTLFLAVLSCAFIATFNYLLLAYVLVYALINYYIGIKLFESNRKTVYYRIGLIFNVLQLALLKYADFLLDPIITLIDSNIEIANLARLITPIGISYFTLQGIGYIINIKLGVEKVERRFANFLVYITFFPKFLSGPVERSNHFLPQLDNYKTFDNSRIIEGIRIALFGCFKKVAIANQLAPIIIEAYGNVSGSDGALLFTVIFIQPLYLYFDFSGYTDIAVGVSKMFGINILPNFNRPFFAENVTSFWRKFHMSLSIWFSDYVFKPTMFKRRKWGNLASIYALLLTWSLFGIWHGAGWNFMVLGIIQAAAVIYEFFTKKWRMQFFSILPNPLRAWLGRLITYSFYGASLVFFFAPDLKAALTFFSRLNIWNGYSFTSNQETVFFVTFLFGSAFMLVELFQNDYPDIAGRIDSWWRGKKQVYRVFRWSLYFFLMSIIIVLSNEVQSFIYFQF